LIITNIIVAINATKIPEGFIVTKIIPTIKKIPVIRSKLGRNDLTTEKIRNIIPAAKMTSFFIVAILFAVSSQN